eukprot:NODE_805_length_4084_cov_0.520703.p1 type:complete len:367 gc:universal NODE_805_length_4084_cov_0.520703:1147-2247(+)
MLVTLLAQTLSYLNVAQFNEVHHQLLLGCPVKTKNVFEVFQPLLNSVRISELDLNVRRLFLGYISACPNKLLSCSSLDYASEDWLVRVQQTTFCEKLATEIVSPDFIQATLYEPKIGSDIVISSFFARATLENNGPTTGRELVQLFVLWPFIHKWKEFFHLKFKENVIKIVNGQDEKVLQLFRSSDGSQLPYFMAYLMALYCDGINPILCSNGLLNKSYLQITCQSWMYLMSVIELHVSSNLLRKRISDALGPESIRMEKDLISRYPEILLGNLNRFLMPQSFRKKGKAEVPYAGLHYLVRNLKSEDPWDMDILNIIVYYLFKSDAIPKEVGSSDEFLVAMSAADFHSMTTIYLNYKKMTTVTSKK